LATISISSPSGGVAATLAGRDRGDGSVCGDWLMRKFPFCDVRIDGALLSIYSKFTEFA
jgi:hypothetical protein